MRKVAVSFFFFLWVCGKEDMVISSENEEYKVIPLNLISSFGNGCAVSGKNIPKEKWLGLVTQEECSLSQKQNNLAKMGASGMLLQSEGAYDLFASHNDSFHIIPISSSLYATLVNIYLEKKKENSSFLSSLPSVRVSLPSSKPFPFLQVSYIIFLILMIFIFPVLFDRLEESQPKIVGLKDLSTLKKCSFSSLITSDQKYEDCPICFDHFSSSSSIRLLQCSHYFHPECIDPWLLSRSCRCPVCNHELSFS